MNRIGLHIIGGTGLALAGAGKPRIAKLVDCSPEYKAQVRAEVGPDCLIVVRWVEPRQDLAAPEAEADAWFARHEAQMRQMSDANVIYEGYNEIPDSMAAAFARFEVRRLQLMHAAGLRCGVGSWSVGVPDLTTWQIYRPALAAMSGGDVVCPHEYWADGSDIGNHWLTARFAHPSIAPYLVGKQIAVTECGRDHVAGRGAAGWQRTCDAETFLGELRAYDALLAHYPTVIGATVFTAGGSSEWAAFDPSAVWPQVVAGYEIEAPAQPPAEEKLMSFGPDPSVSYYHSARSGYAPDWLILHDTEGPAAAALAWWRDPANPGRSSAHWLVKTNGEVVSVVPERYAAHHAGGGTWPGIPSGSVGGTSVINLVSIGIELEYPKAPATPVWPAVQLDAAVALTRTIIERYRVPREHLLRHADVSPATRSDPRAFDWAGFLARAYGPGTPVAEGLPQHEPEGPPAFTAEKLRWWTEELTRTIQAGDDARAAAILDGLINLEYGLMYRLERQLKAA